MIPPRNFDQTPVDQTSPLLDEIAALTKALTGLTCGGSEFFIRKGDRYVADIPACVEYVRRFEQGQHEYILKLSRQLQDARAAAASPALSPETMGGSSLGSRQSLPTTDAGNGPGGAK